MMSTYMRMFFGAVTEMDKEYFTEGDVLYMLGLLDSPDDEYTACFVYGPPARDPSGYVEHMARNHGQSAPRHYYDNWLKGQI